MHQHRAGSRTCGLLTCTKGQLSRKNAGSAAFLVFFNYFVSTHICQLTSKRVQYNRLYRSLISSHSNPSRIDMVEMKMIRLDEGISDVKDAISNCRSPKWSHNELIYSNSFE